MKRSRVGGTLLEKHGFADGDLYESAHDRIQMWVIDNSRKIYEDNLNTTKFFESVLARWTALTRVEVPLKNKQDYIAGFVDCVIEGPRVGITDEDPYGERTNLYLEVKSHVESFGSIVRELQFYKFHLDRLPCIKIKKEVGLVAPPLPYADRIREQGFIVVEYTGD